MQTCARCEASNPDGARFCNACGAPMGRVGAGSRRLATIVFCDLVESTELVQRMDAESARSVVTRYFETMQAVIERHGGTVEKFIGDAIAAVFGIPRLHEDDAVRAVRAAAEMRETLGELNRELEASWDVRLQARIGVSSGEVVAGDPLSGQSFASGGPVHVAARLEQAASPGEILLADATHRLVRDAVIVEAADPLGLKGFDEPLRAYRLVEVRRGAAGHARRAEALLVDRERELALLRDTFERTLSGRQCQLFTILGQAGIGKTRLLEEFLKVTGARATTLRGRCLAYGEGITYWPVAEMVEEAADLGAHHDPEQIRARIEALMGGEDRAPVAAERVAQAIGVGGAPAVPEETFWGIRTLFEAMAKIRPLVLVFDDVHWAEPTLLALIDHIAEWAKDVPIMAVCPARPELLELDPSWGGGKLNATTVLLEPLTDDDTGVLIRNILGNADLEPQVRARMLEAGGGNPLFVEEMLSMLIEDRTLVRRGDRWAASGDQSGVSLPPTIAALLSARLDQLAPAERTALEHASVIGQVFSEAPASALGSAELGLGPVLSSLMRKDLIRPTGVAGQHRFRHILIRDAAYGSIPKDARAELHERYAEWLEQHSDRPEEHEEIIGYHLEQAHRYRSDLGGTKDRRLALATRAGGHLASAGRRAYARGDMPATVNLLRRATSLLPDDDPSIPELLPEFADALSQTSSEGEARDVWTRLLDHARRQGDGALEALASLEVNYRDFFTDPTGVDIDRFKEEALAAVRAQESANRQEGIATTLVHLSATYWLRGEIDELLPTAERALELATQSNHLRALQWAATSLSAALLMGSTSCEDALGRLQQLMSRFTEPRVVRASTQLDVALVLGMLERFEDALMHARVAHATLEDFGQEAWLAESALTIGTICRWNGDLETAERETSAGLATFETQGNASAEALAARDLARVLVALDRLDDAAALAERALNLAGGYDLEPQIEGRSILALVRARQGLLDEARSLSQEAIALVQPTGFLNLHALVLADQAEVFLMERREHQAEAAAVASLARFERKGNLVGAGLARSILDRTRVG